MRKNSFFGKIKDFFKGGSFKRAFKRAKFGRLGVIVLAVVVGIIVLGALWYLLFT